MFLTILILAIFPIIILLESYFIGKYFSISQNVFKQNEYASFSLGIVAYLAITFISYLPFSFIGLNKNYFLIVMVIKDLFIIIFLISRSYAFKGIKINYKFAIILIIISIFLAIFEEYVLPFQWDIELTTRNDLFKTFWNYMSSISSIFNISISNVYIYSILPITTTSIVCIFGSFIFMLVPRYNFKNFLIIIATTTASFALFHGGIGSVNFLGLSMLLFLVFSSYNLFVYSRRRYATIFATTAIAMWSINDKYFLAILLVAIVSVVMYFIYKRPKTIQFSLQILFPLMILSSIWVSDYSSTLAFVIALVSLIIYVILFYFGSHEKIFTFTKKVNLYNLPILALFVSMLIWIVTSLVIKNNDFNESIQSNIVLLPVMNDLGLEWPNILVYSLYSALIVLFSYRAFRMYKNSGYDYFLYFTLFLLIIGFNPLVMNAVKGTILNQFYKYINFVVFVPIFVLVTSKIIQKIKITT